MEYNEIGLEWAQKSWRLAVTRWMGAGIVWGHLHSHIQQLTPSVICDLMWSHQQVHLHAVPLCGLGFLTVASVSLDFLHRVPEYKIRTVPPLMTQLWKTHVIIATPACWPEQSRSKGVRQAPSPDGVLARIESGVRVRWRCCCDHLWKV